jgi:enolase
LVPVLRWRAPSAGAPTCTWTSFILRHAGSGDYAPTVGVINRYEEIVTHHPVWSIEDGLAESDWDGWVALT